MNYYVIFYNYIIDYLIDKNIIINENDNNINKLKNYLLKYKRIIAIILLIILLIIGYYCDLKYLDFNFNNLQKDNNKNNKILVGGTNSTPVAAPVVSPVSTPAPAPASGAAAPAAKEPKGKRSKTSKVLKGYKPKALTAASKSKAAKAVKGAYKDVKSTLKDGKMAALKSAGKGMSSFAQNRVDSFKEFAPWFYGILYSIAITIIGCIVVLPALGFFFIGIVCYALLKDKIGYIKGL